MSAVVEAAAPGKTSVGWIGTGVMGASMASRLLAAGYAVTVTSRSPGRAQPLIDAGAAWAGSPSEVAKASSIVFSMVGYPADVRSVMFGDDGVLAGISEGSVIVDMTTSEPTLAVELAEAASTRGSFALDAPVSGGDIGARNGTLSIMIGGDVAAVETVRPCLAEMGGTIVHHGGPGAGQHTKMVNQTLIAGTLAAVAEALAYAQRAGLDMDRVLESVSTGAAGSWTLSNLAPRALAGNFAPGFYVDHFVKDMGIALTEARSMQLAMPTLALVEQLCIALQAAGHGRDGTQSLIAFVASLGGLDRNAGPATSGA